MLYWNINGLTNDKLHDNMLGSFFKKFDSILLTETWTNENSDVELEGYTFHNCPRKYKHANAKRDSGGIGIFVRNDIKNGVVIGKNHDDILAWLTLKDLYVVNIYMVPHSSVHMRDDVFSLLYEDLAQIPCNSNVLLCGDYNAHTNVLPEFDIETSYGSEGDLANLLPRDIHKSCDNIQKLFNTGRVARFSKDFRPANVQGLQLNDLCKDTGLLIMNGRLGMDKGIGGYTRMGVGERGIVDYVIGSPELFDMISLFKMGQKVPESDHLPLIFSVMCSIKRIYQSGSYVSWQSQWK